MENQKLKELVALDYQCRDELEKTQLERLQSIVAKCYETVPLFRDRMDEKGLKPDCIKTLKDITKLPFTQKTDLRDTYPHGLFAEPLKDVTRLHASSGTTGKPIVVGYTQKDIDTWSSIMMRALNAVGVSDEDIIQVGYGYGLFTGGLGAHYGAEAIGATTIPIGGGNTERQMMMMQDFGVTTVMCTPSYFVFLIEKFKENGIDFNNLKLKRGIFGAEPWTLEMRDYIERETGIKAFDIYGLTEIMGPGVGIECEKQHGFHIFEDHFLMEILDPETEEPLPDGEWGELVFTTLTKEAFPMIRYKTHDITRIIAEKCECGRTIRRIDRIQTRCDDMMIIRGVNVFPSQIEAAIMKVAKSEPHYQIIRTLKDNLEQIAVEVEVTAAMFSDKIGEIEDMKKQIAQSIEHTVGIRVPVRLVEPGTIARSEGKAKRVIDLRNQAQ